MQSIKGDIPRFRSASLLSLKYSDKSDNYTLNMSSSLPTGSPSIVDESDTYSPNVGINNGPVFTQVSTE